MLKVLRRHYPPCKRREWDQGYTKCTCPIWIRGTLAGRRITKPVSKFLSDPDCRDMDSACALAAFWERSQAPNRLEGSSLSVPMSEKADGEGAEASNPTIASAVALYLQSARARNLASATQLKLNTLFRKQLLGWCALRGYRFLAELGVTQITDWRDTWKDQPLARSKKQDRVIGFFYFCVRRGLLKANAITNETLGQIKVVQKPTGYFDPAQYTAIVDATYTYTDRPRHGDSIQLGGVRIRALTELMRWTGLRIRDAITLERSRFSQDPIDGTDRIMIYQKKTGEPVHCLIPPRVADLLRNLPAGPKGIYSPTYFFWTGNGEPKSVVANWQRSYRKLFAIAGLKNSDDKPKRCHPHMFRDTFAVESLLNGMRVEEVSTLLGHSSVKITEKHYLPWVRARQNSLNESVKAAWSRQGVFGDARTLHAASRGRKQKVVVLSSPRTPAVSE